jgi:hypothetical protein
MAFFVAALLAYARYQQNTRRDIDISDGVAQRGGRC